MPHDVRITAADLERGVAEFEKREGRDSMYRVASFLLEQWWGKYAEMADALAVLLLTWNQAFYRYGLFDAKRLESCLARNWRAIEGFHSRQISTFDEEDHDNVVELFDDLLTALATSKGRSPVAVAKGLHLLAPNFFPIWDQRIAKEYDCSYASNPGVTYIRFCDTNRELVKSLRRTTAPSSKTLLKRIDEYNYARFTKGWIE